MNTRTLPTDMSFILASCSTVNKQSLQIRIANVFTIILVLTVCGCQEPLACSFIVRPSQNSFHHLNTLDHVITSIPHFCLLEFSVSIDDFSRCTQKSITACSFIISLYFVFFNIFSLYYIHCRGESNNFL